MERIENNQDLLNSTVDYLEEQIDALKSMLSYALNIPTDEIKASFPALSNFYYVNNVYKSSWAIYTHKDKLPKLLFTGNFLVQGGKYGNRSTRSPFGAKALSPLTSIANTFSHEASTFKQNWTLDLNLFEEDTDKLAFSVKEYKEFLNLLNKVRAQWLLHLSEEENIDFVISEFSEPSDAIFFMDLESFDSQATKIKTYFKPISENSLKLFQKLARGTEFEGRFFNLQPGAWLRDDVILEIGSFYNNDFKSGFDENKDTLDTDYNFSNPFKMQVFKLLY